jgi:hypothetical protein
MVLLSHLLEQVGYFLTILYTLSKELDVLGVMNNGTTSIDATLNGGPTFF